MCLKLRVRQVWTTIFALGLFCSPVVSEAQTWVDMDGDGITDFVQVRDQGGSVVWYSSLSGGGTRVQPWGLSASDFVTPSDFDGDNETDVAIWRDAPAGSAAFYVYESSTSTPRIELFGQTGDDPAVTGDYDGDGEADLAVFRCPSSIAAQCHYFYRGSAGGSTTQIPWGFGTDSTIFPCPGDYDGDGRHDFCVQRENPSSAGQGQFVILRSSDFGVEFIDWGLITDRVVPGDFDGDGRDDLTIVRNNGGQLNWWTRRSSGGHQVTIWGLSGDLLTPGDYDGDGKVDVAIFRPNADPTANLFWILRSSDFGVNVFEWGQQGDYPVATSQIH